MIIAGGKIVGSWRRNAPGEIELQYPGALTRAQDRAVNRAVQRFLAFSGSDSGP